MPIKSCTRCGLKVLVDAQAAATDNFLCTRCAPDAAPASAPKPSGGGKRPSVKVTCPYCGASFSGSKPSRPAKGGCPVCQKELVLLPDGTIQAAATFNLAAWQKERKSSSNPPSSAPAPVAAPEPPVEMPSAPDPLGGSTILDMGGPPGEPPPASIPTLDEPTMAMPGGLGGETMLGMGSDAPPAPAPSIDEPALPEPDLEDVTSPPPDLGGATILDMGPRPVELPPPDIDEPPAEPDLLKETMPGIDRPPSADSPVPTPTPPPIPEEMSEEPASDVTEGPTIRDAEEPEVEAEPESEPEPETPLPVEAEAASIESAPEIPGDLGGQTILDMGGANLESKPEPAPSIEDPPPEAVPILAKDVAPEDPQATDATEGASGEATPKPYVYQPIPRGPRKPPPVRGDPLPPPLSSPGARASVPNAPSSPPPPPTGGAPVLGSDFRIASAPPPPNPVVEKKPAGPKTTAAVMPRAVHSLGKLALAWVLLLLPGLTVFALHSLQKNPGVEKVINGIRAEAKPGIKKISDEFEKAVKKQPEPPAESK